MNDGVRLLQERGAKALWDRTLGYLDMSLDEAMATQHRLLADQLRTLQASELGRELLSGMPIASTEEFRERVPLTTYDTYDSTLGDQKQDALALATRTWIRTSGRTRARHKWIPIPGERFTEMNWVILGAFMLAAADERGQVKMKPDARILNMTAPPPYGSGTFVEGMTELLGDLRLFPPPSANDMPFDQRNGLAFSEAITNGVDYIGALPVILAGIGESFASRKPPGSIIDRLKNPRAFGRMGRAMLRSKLAGRGLYPRDVFDLQGIVVGGMDGSLFRDKINQYWGRPPHEMFVSSEGLMVALQAWDRTSLTLVPTLNFLEFLSEDDMETDSPTPRTYLMDEIEVGKNYEVVITNFMGGPLVRYRTGDIMRVTEARNARAGINLPQVISYGRNSDTMDVAGFARINEQTMWRAIEDARVPYVDWTARKEIHGDQPVVHLRIEPRPGAGPTSEDASARIHEALKLLDPDWKDMEAMAGLKPLVVTYLPSGAFDRYTEKRRLAGADLGQLKPMHMNAPDTAIEALLEAAGVGGGSDR